MCFTTIYAHNSRARSLRLMSLLVDYVKIAMLSYQEAKRPQEPKHFTEIVKAEAVEFGGQPKSPTEAPHHT